MKNLIGSGEAARRLGVSRSTFQRMVKRGEIVPVHRIDGIRGSMTFDPADLPSLQTMIEVRDAKQDLVRDLFKDAGIPLTEREVQDRAGQIVGDVRDDTPTD